MWNFRVWHLISVLLGIYYRACWSWLQKNKILFLYWVNFPISANIKGHKSRGHWGQISLEGQWMWTSLPPSQCPCQATWPRSMSPLRRWLPPLRTRLPPPCSTSSLTSTSGSLRSGFHTTGLGSVSSSGLPTSFLSSLVPTREYLLKIWKLIELTQERQWWTVVKGLNSAILWLSGTLLLLFSVGYLTSIGRTHTLPKAQRTHCLNEASFSFAVLKKNPEDLLLLVVVFLIFCGVSLWNWPIEYNIRIFYISGIVGFTQTFPELKDHLKQGLILLPFHVSLCHLDSFSMYGILISSIRHFLVFSSHIAV